MLIDSYIKDNRQDFIEELMDLLKVPSISADKKNKKDILDMANILKKKMLNIGLEKVEILNSLGNPVVYAEHILDEKLPTILVYGHYDVQPPDPLDLWDNPPFSPTIKKTKLHPQGAIFGRGTCDNKGQFHMHIKAFETMLKTGNLKCNVKFIIEGEEEIGSPNLAEFIKIHKDKLKNDVIIISDTNLISNDVPCITISARGLAYIEVKLSCSNRDLHSGLYGGIVANPINSISKVIASLHDDKNNITIKDFYRDVIYREDLVEKDNEAVFDNYFEQKRKDIGIRSYYNEHGYSIRDSLGLRPCLDVNGIYGGYTGEGAKTVIPSSATAKISMRLVPNQSEKHIVRATKEHLKSLIPSYLDVEFISHGGGDPYYISKNDIGYKAAEMAMEESFAKKPVAFNSGASIPIMAVLEKELDSKCILMGFGLDSDGIHAPNEHFGIFNYFKGIETISLFHKHFYDLF